MLLNITGTHNQNDIATQRPETDSLTRTALHHQHAGDWRHLVYQPTATDQQVLQLLTSAASSSKDSIFHCRTGTVDYAGTARRLRLARERKLQ